MGQIQVIRDLKGRQESETQSGARALLFLADKKSNVLRKACGDMVYSIGPVL